MKTKYLASVYFYENPTEKTLADYINSLYNAFEKGQLEYHITMTLIKKAQEHLKEHCDD